jgi:hypothetical protein
MNRLWSGPRAQTLLLLWFLAVYAAYLWAVWDAPPLQIIKQVLRAHI